MDTNKFDPTKYGAIAIGAKPSISTANVGGNFDPLAYGAVPQSASAPKANTQTVGNKPMPILTNESGDFGTAVRDIAVGAGKDFIDTARGTAGLFQSAGKTVLGAFGVDTSNMGLKSIDNSTPEGAQIQGQLDSKSRGEQVGKVLSNVFQLGTGFATKEGQLAVTKAQQATEAYKATKEAKSTAKVVEMISPKETVKQARIAQAEGRLVEGKAPTLFRAGTEGKILPSQKTLNATKTIVESIPDAPKMKPAELYRAVDNTITQTAKELRPKMLETPIKPETVTKINNNWEAIKKSQILEAPATEEINVIKRQAKFESFLRKSGSGTHADLWDTRIAYDDSIPEGVKKATTFSPESLQIQKEEWLQNRDVLNRAINDNAFGMGKESQDAFAKMSNLYEAKTGLLSKARVDNAQLSKINQYLKDNPVVAKALGGVGIYEILKRLGVPIP